MPDVMSLEPKQLTLYGFIWGGHEQPTLASRYSQGGAGAPTRLISIDASDYRLQYEIDIVTQAYIGTVKRDDPDYLDPDSFDLHTRDTCTENLEYQGNDDWFG